jgi:hypothetical protein
MSPDPRPAARGMPLSAVCDDVLVLQLAKSNN